MSFYDSSIVDEMRMGYSTIFDARDRAKRIVQGGDSIINQSTES